VTIGFDPEASGFENVIMPRLRQKMKLMGQCDNDAYIEIFAASLNSLRLNIKICESVTRLMCQCTDEEM
jgi:hypothetical protein